MTIPLWARRTDSFHKYSRVPVAVGIVPAGTVLFPAINIRGFDSAIIFVDNDGADQFDGVVEFSPDGVYPGTTEPDDAFAAMVAGGPARWTRIPADAQWFRVSGGFLTIPGNVRVSVFLMRGT